MMFGVRAKAHLHLAVVFVCIMKGETDTKHSEFRCTFENNKYKLDTDSPIWSSKSTPSELIFNDNNEWLNFQGKIRQAFTEVIERGYALNNMDHFIRFIRAYKNQRGQQKNLESFFDNYHVPGIKPLQDPVSFLVEINQHLNKNYPPANNLLYMASAYVHPSKLHVADVRKSHDNILDYAEKDAKDALTKSRFQRHIAGIIKIQVNNTKGIVILDPGYYSDNECLRVFPYSVFMMEKNNNSSFIGGQLYGESKALETVLAHKFGLVTFITPPNLFNETLGILYLRNRPFCSFMDSTIKGNLLELGRGKLTFEKDGSPKGYLNFYILDQNITQEKPYFVIGPIRNGNKRTFLLNKFYFDSIRPDDMTWRTKELMNENTKYLGIDFLSKLQTIWSKVIQDRNLMSEIYKLNQELDKDIKKKSKIQDLFNRLRGTL